MRNLNYRNALAFHPMTVNCVNSDLQSFGASDEFSECSAVPCGAVAASAHVLELEPLLGRGAGRAARCALPRRQPPRALHPCGSCARCPSVCGEVGFQSRNRERNKHGPL